MLKMTKFDDLNRKLIRVNYLRHFQNINEKNWGIIETAIFLSISPMPSPKLRGF